MEREHKNSWLVIRMPHVVDKITDQNGNVVQEIGTNVRRQVISESASDTIRQIMDPSTALAIGKKS